MGTFSALLAICAGNSSVTGEFPAQRPVTRSFDVFFDLRLHEQLSKQWWGWWFETPSRPLWRYSNVDESQARSVIHGHSDYFFFVSETGDTTSDQLMTIISAMVLFGSLAGVHILFCLSSTLKPIQNGRHFADDIFKCIFLNENSIGISLKCVTRPQWAS